MLASTDPYLKRDACEAIGAGRLEEFIPDLAALLRDEDAGVREAAINSLTATGGQKAAQAVVPLLRDTDPVFRNMAREVLELLGQDSFESLCGLLGEGDDDVVKFAVDIIASVREERAIDLLAPLIGHRNPNVRASVAVCLGKLRSPKSVPALLDALGDSEEWVRFSAIEGLGHMQERKALVPLIKLIENDSGLIKEAAIDAVARMASPIDAASVLLKLEPLVRKGKAFSTGSVVDLLEKVFSPGSEFRPTPDFKKTYCALLLRSFEECDRQGQLKVLRGLALLRMPDAMDLTFRFIEAQSDLDDDIEAFLVDTVVTLAGRRLLPSMQDKVAEGGKCLRIVVRALGEMKAAAAVPILKDLVGRVAKNELRDVVVAIESIGSAGSIEVLYDLLKSTDGHTRKIASRALASLAGPSALASLFEALRAEKYRDVMEEMTDRIALVPSDQVRKGFCALLGDESESLREMGARGLGHIGDDEALDALKLAAKDACPGVRKAAYKSMARLGIPYAIDEIVNGLLDSSDDVKLSVLKGLGGWSGEKIKSALLQALTDRNIWVRYHSVLLLGELGEQDVEELIIDKLVKDEAPVKAAAAKALERLGATGALDILMQFIDHPDPSVRGAVESAIESFRC